MGLTELVPGISGGTIAFITGIYNRLLYNISHLSPSVFTNIFDLGVARWWKEYDLAFMVTLFGSMIFSIVIFANIIEYLLIKEKVATFSFFLWANYFCNFYAFQKKLEDLV